MSTGSGPLFAKNPQPIFSSSPPRWPFGRLLSVKRSVRISAVLVAIAAFFILIAIPAFAQDEEETTEPTIISESSGLEPAVPIPDEKLLEAVPDWTYRYMIPTTLALVAVVILLTSIKYFTDVVRKRYRIVEE